MIKGISKHSFILVWCKLSTFLLALSWVAGLLLGVCSAFSASSFLVPMMRESIGCSVSIPGLLVAAFLPFLFSIYAVYLSEPWFLLIISTLKAFCFGFCACGVSLAFGHCSWLVRFLFLFTDVFSIPVLYWYWVKHIKIETKPIVQETLVCMGFVACFVAIDYCFVAPFLVSLIES